MYKVLHKPSGHTFALKILTRGALTEREVSIPYTNAVPVYGCFGSSGTVQVLMPYYKLGDLNGAGALTEPVAKGVAAQVADCLASMHATGHVHRDIKRHNVLLDDTFELTGRVVVAEFGFATHVDEGRTRCRGTLDYLAPEVAMNQKPLLLLTTACDIFALGVIRGKHCERAHLLSPAARNTGFQARKCRSSARAITSASLPSSA